MEGRAVEAGKHKAEEERWKGHNLFLIVQNMNEYI
jgi:hypothetical protein